jgi:hypothetical protein
MKKVIEFFSINDSKIIFSIFLIVVFIILIFNINSTLNRIQNVTGLKQKLAAIKLENKQLLEQNNQASNYIDSLKSVLLAKQNEITWYAMKDQAVVAKLYEINHHLINLNIKYEKANDRVANFNSDSIIRYFSNIR